MPPTHEPATDAVRERARRVTQGGDTAAGRETAGRVPSAPSRPSRGMPHTLVLRLQQQFGADLPKPERVQAVLQHFQARETDVILQALLLDKLGVPQATVDAAFPARGS